jgi:hypothetical protein
MRAVGMLIALVARTAFELGHEFIKERKRMARKNKGGKKGKGC